MGQLEAGFTEMWGIATRMGIPVLILFLTGYVVRRWNLCR